MSQRINRSRSSAASPPSASRSGRSRNKVWAGVAGAAALVVGAVAWMSQRGSSSPATSLVVSASSKAPLPTNAALPSNEVAQALMVTVELDFGERIPSIKEALKEVERRYEPESGRGRTFAILDAYGEPTATGKLHLSMHLSMEKPGIGLLVFRRTGEVLWKSRIVPAKKDPPAEKRLTVIMDDGSGKQLMLDGSQGVERVLDVPFRDSPTRVRDQWPEGQEREFTFIYSVCGCPVKAKVRRAGETTARTSELPVMFPDDPAALVVIHQLMGWPAAR